MSHKAGVFEGDLSERNLQKQVIALAKFLGYKVYHPLLSKWSEKGWPDLSMVRGSRLVFIELKSEKGKVTDSQRAWLAALERVPGVQCYVFKPSDWYAGRVEEALA